ncbi:MAG: hypothetical protein JWP00_3290, partial [Chloroflexi bacterium]|nr:hypothetical protein [Chloroflexota bacterium]
PNLKIERLGRVTKMCQLNLVRLAHLLFSRANPKAHIHTYLDWQEDPGTPLGPGITRKYFDAGVLRATNL